MPELSEEYTFVVTFANKFFDETCDALEEFASSRTDREESEGLASENVIKTSVGKERVSVWELYHVDFGILRVVAFIMWVGKESVWSMWRVEIDIYVEEVDRYLGSSLLSGSSCG